jgi:hypothetical protein
VSLARRAESVPPAAVVRAVTGFYSSGVPRPVPGRREIHHCLVAALEAARVQGELPEYTDTDELARVLAALAMDALLRWAQGDPRRLRPLLKSRAEIVLGGVTAVSSAKSGSKAGPGRRPAPAATRAPDPR